MTESVGDPGSHAWTAGNRGAGIHEGVSRVMIDLIGLLGTNDADVVGNLLNVGEKAGNLLSGLSAFFEFDFRAKTLERGVLEESEFNPFSQLLWDRLSIVFTKLRLVIETLKLRRATGHVEVDDSLGFGCVIEILGLLGEAILEEERGESGAREGG